MALDVQASKHDVGSDRPGRSLLSHNQKWALGFLAVDGKSCAIALGARQVAIQPIDNHKNK